MQSLVDLSAKTILKHLTLDCQEILVDHLLKDRVYDLATYVVAPQNLAPQDGYFVVFMQDGYGNTNIIGLTTHVASLCFQKATEAGINFHAYHIPRSPFNDVIEIKQGDLQPNETKVTVTCRDRTTPPGYLRFSIEQIRSLVRTDLVEWQEWQSPQVPTTYWIPK